MKVLIVTYRRADLLRRCVSQLGAHFLLSDLLVVDNDSPESDVIAAYCAENGIGLIRNDSNEGFAKAVNVGMRRLVDRDDHSWVLLLNADTELLVDPHDLIRSASPKWAAITSFDASAHSPWDSEKPFPNPWRAAWEDSGFGRLRLPQPLGSRFRTFSSSHKGYLVGCFLLVSTAAWRRIGPFDERFWLYSEEVDWCLRAYQAGMECAVIPVLGYRHLARQSAAGSSVDIQNSEAAYRNSRILFIEKHWGPTGVRLYAGLVSMLVGLRRSTRIVRRPLGKGRKA